MVDGLGAVLRAYAYRAFTRLGPERVTALERAAAGRAALALAERAAGRGTVTVSGGLGRGLQLDARHLPLRHVQAYGLVRGALEPSVQEALRRCVRSGDVVYDVGANVGMFALLAWRLGARVEAFEPSPDNVRALRANVALNEAQPVRVHELAIGAHSGRGRLLHVAERSWSHLDDRGWHPGTDQVVDVEVAALDDLVDLPPPALVKIDVEGSEIAVLEGARRTLADHRPVLIVETHGTNAEVVALLREAGYALENLDGPEPVEDAGPVHVLARAGG